MERENTFFLNNPLPNTVKGSLSTYHVYTFLIQSLTKINMEALEILENVFHFSEIRKKYSSKKIHLYLNTYSATILIDPDYVFLLKCGELCLFPLLELHFWTSQKFKEVSSILRYFNFTKRIKGSSIHPRQLHHTKRNMENFFFF